MKLDPFMALVMEGEISLEGDANGKLSDLAEAFLRAGGGFSIQEWAHYNEASKAALINAQRKIKEEEAARIAYYITHPKEAILALAGEDGLVRAALEGKLATDVH